jgi:hypothetical protein
MAYTLNTEHVNWARWVDGETAKAQRFNRIIGDFGFSPARSTRWRQLASELTSPDYRTNFEYQRAHHTGTLSRASLRFLDDKATFHGRISQALKRTPSLPAVPRHSPTPSYQDLVKRYPGKKLSSRKLQLSPSGK